MRDLWLTNTPDAVAHGWPTHSYRDDALGGHRSRLSCPKHRLQRRSYGALYREGADGFARAFPEDDRRTTVFLPTEGTEGETPQEVLFLKPTARTTSSCNSRCPET